MNLTVIFDEHALSEQSVFDKIAAAKQAGATSGVDLWEASRLPQAGDAGLIQKLTSKEIPNLDKVPQTALDRYKGFGAPYRASSVILAGLIIPPAVVPTIFLLQTLGIYKTLFGLIMVEVAFALPFATLILRAFVASIPREIDESAILDGASPLRLFFSIVLPLLWPAVVTVIVVQSVAIYNDFAGYSDDSGAYRHSRAGVEHELAPREESEVPKWMGSSMNY